MSFFWVLVQCRFVGRSQRFGETYCLHLQGPLQWKFKLPAQERYCKLFLFVLLWNVATIYDLQRRFSSTQIPNCEIVLCLIVQGVTWTCVLFALTASNERLTYPSDNTQAAREYHTLIHRTPHMEVCSLLVSQYDLISDWPLNSVLEFPNIFPHVREN
jgi:hypothetical protein